MPSVDPAARLAGRQASRMALGGVGGGGGGVTGLHLDADVAGMHLRPLDVTT